MKNTVRALFAATFLSCFALASFAGAQDIQLTEPDFKSGTTVLEALKNRKSSRAFDDGAKTLAPQQLSEVLWAAGGVNRKDGGRTAPSANNGQAIDIYAFLADGAYKYDPAAHKLVLVAKGDFRAATGTQGFVAKASLNLLYVARMADVPGGSLTTAAYDAGHISENVYLYCASSGLNVIVRASLNAEKLGEILALPENHKPLLGQTVGFPPR